MLELGYCTLHFWPPGGGLGRQGGSDRCSLQAVAGNITSAHLLHVHIGSKNRRGIWHTRNEAVDRSGKGNLPVFLYWQVVMNKLFFSGRCR